VNKNHLIILNRAGRCGEKTPQRPGSIF